MLHEHAPAAYRREAFGAGMVERFSHSRFIRCTFNQSTKQFQIALIIICGLFVGFTKIDQARKSLTWSFGAPSRTRTDTGLILSQLPLPLGYGGLYKAARWPRAQSTALVYKTLSRKGNSGSLNGVLGVYISDD